MDKFCYVYVLQSLKDHHLYVGLTRDLRNRFKEHQDGRVPATTNRRPFVLVYYEAGRDIHKAAQREKYLKTAWGKRYLKHRLSLAEFNL